MGVGCCKCKRQWMDLPMSCFWTSVKEASGVVVVSV